MVGQTYFLIAWVMLIGVGATWLSPEPPTPVNIPRNVAEAVWEPVHEFFFTFTRTAMLSLIVLYKLGDAFAGSLTTAFLIRGMGFEAPRWDGE